MISLNNSYFNNRNFHHYNTAHHSYFNRSNYISLGIDFELRVKAIIQLLLFKEHLVFE